MEPVFDVLTFTGEERGLLAFEGDRKPSSLLFGQRYHVVLEAERKELTFTTDLSRDYRYLVPPENLIRSDNSSELLRGMTMLSRIEVVENGH